MNKCFFFFNVGIIFYTSWVVFDDNIVIAVHINFTPKMN